jgi:Galactosyltransferase
MMVCFIITVSVLVAVIWIIDLRSTSFTTIRSYLNIITNKSIGRRTANASSIHLRRKDFYHPNTYTNDTSHFDYDIPIPLYGTNRLPDPKVVPFRTEQLVIAVLSERSNYYRREIIRQTWGKAYVKSLLFVIGGRLSTSNTSLYEELQAEQQRLIEEQELYEDLLDSVHPESYQSLPHKLRYAIHWLVQNCQSHIAWIMKVDEDMYVQDLRRYATLSSTDPIVTTTPVVMGCIQYNVPVQRHGKWAEEASFYVRYPIYPPWPKGSCGYILNHAVAMIISQNYQSDLQILYLPTKVRPSTSAKPYVIRERRRDRLLVPSYQGEDTSLGIWLQYSNVTFLQSPFFVDHGRCNLQETNTLGRNNMPFIMDNATKVIEAPTKTIPWCIGHQMSTEHIQRCFNVERDSNWTYPDSPMNVQLPRLSTRTANDAYDVALIRHEVDQKALRNEKEAEERSKARAVKRTNRLWHLHQRLKGD